MHGTWMILNTYNHFWNLDYTVSSFLISVYLFTYRLWASMHGYECCIFQPKPGASVPVVPVTVGWWPTPSWGTPVSRGSPPPDWWRRWRQSCVLSRRRWRLRRSLSMSYLRTHASDLFVVSCNHYEGFSCMHWITHTHTTHMHLCSVWNQQYDKSTVVAKQFTPANSHRTIVL